MNELTIRLATLEDAERLVEIYAPYVEKTGISFEYEVPTVQEFANRIAQISSTFPYLVAERDGRVIGYAYASYYRTREAYSWNVECSIYLDEEERGKGDGAILYTALERILQAQGVTNLNACIAVPNPASIRFHEKLGYKLVAEFNQSGYKLNQWFGTIWLEKMVNEHTVPPKPIIPIGQLDIRHLIQ